MSDIFKLIIFMIIMPLASIYVYEDEKFEWEQFIKKILTNEKENKK